MKKMKNESPKPAAPRSIVPGDVHYSKLSHTLKFTISINERVIMLLEDATGNNMLSPEEAALALCDLASAALENGPVAGEDSTAHAFFSEGTDLD
jgi:hypothetical protein